MMKYDIAVNRILTIKQKRKRLVRMTGMRHYLLEQDEVQSSLAGSTDHILLLTDHIPRRTNHILSPTDHIQHQTDRNKQF